MYFEDIENPTDEQKQGNEELAKVLEQIQDLTRRATEIADKYRLTFKVRADGYGRYDPDNYGWETSSIC